MYESEIHAEIDAIQELLSTGTPNTAYDRAVANLERSHRTGNKLLIAKSAFYLASCAEAYQPDPKYDKAIRAYQFAREKVSEIGNHEKYANIQNNLGALFCELPTGDKGKNLQKAIKCFEDALRFRTRKDRPVDFAVTQGNLGIAYCNLPCEDNEANLRKGIQCFKNALRVYTETDFPEDYALVQHNSGKAFYRLSASDRKKLEKAIQCFENALKIFTYPDFPEKYADTQMDMGNAFSRLSTGDRTSNLKAAIACYENALRVFNPGEFPKSYADAQNNLGNVYAELPTGNKTSNLRQAMNCYENALQIFTETGFPKEYAMVQNNMGSVWLEFPTGSNESNLLKATECFQNALRVNTETAFPEKYAMIQNNLGNVCCNLMTGDRKENLQAAVTCFENALHIYTEQDFPEYYAMTQHNMGTAYAEMPALDQDLKLIYAIDCFKNALRIYTKTNFPESYAMIQSNMGTAYMKLGEIEENTSDIHKATDCFQKALQIYTEKAFPFHYAMIQNSLGNAYREINPGNSGLETAIYYFQKALRVYTKTDFPQEYAITQNNLGNAYGELTTGNRKANLLKAVSAYQKALQYNTESEFPQKRIKTLYNLAITWNKPPLNRYRKAYEILVQAIEILENQVRTVSSAETRNILADTYAGLYNHMISTCISLKKYKTALHYVQRSKSRTLREMLYSAHSENSHPVIMQNHLRNQPVPETSLLIPEHDKTIIIECFIGDHATYIFIMDGKNDISSDNCLVLKKITISELFRRLLSQEWIEPYGYYRTESGNSCKKGIHARQLWFEALENTVSLIAENFWHAQDENGISLSSLVEQRNPKRIVFIPHSGLHLLPLHLIPVDSHNSGIKRLMDQYEIAYSPSVSILKNKKPGSDNFFAVANPDHTLCFAEAEIQAVAKYFAYSLILRHENADKTSVLAHAGRADIIHFGCHGYADLLEALNSALILASGNFTLRDIFSELKLPQAELVVLSSCETGMIQLERGDEFIGLPSGFLYAGACSVISPLWAVNDFSTCLLIQFFYENLVKEKMGKAAALRNSQQKVRDMKAKDIRPFLEQHFNNMQKQNKPVPFKIRRLRKKYQNMPDNEQPFLHPYYWGAFVCTGNWI